MATYKKNAFYWVRKHDGDRWRPAEFDEGAFWIAGEAGSSDVRQVGDVIRPPPEGDQWIGQYVQFANDHPLQKATDSWVTYSLNGDQHAVQVEEQPDRATAAEQAAKKNFGYGKIDLMGIKAWGRLPL